uniref:Uncharacterized protein n=1 Tax=Arundo donax TaxID=35708 RepID=A0A0A9A453_ARUDO
MQQFKIQKHIPDQFYVMPLIGSCDSGVK